MRNGTRFTEGDHIRVYDPESGTIVHGTALDTRDHFGWAWFRVKVGDNVLDFNLNHVHVTLLFSADHARAMGGEH